VLTSPAGPTWLDLPELQAFVNGNEVLCELNRFTRCLDYIIAAAAQFGLAGDPGAARGAVVEACPLTDLTCCTDGEKHVDGSVCCGGECDVCGGLGCGLFTGGSSRCCKADLDDADACVLVTDMACNCPIEGRPTHEPTAATTSRRVQEAHGGRRDNACANGIVHKVRPERMTKTKKNKEGGNDAALSAEIEVCCDASCGACGGPFCHVLSNDAARCCAEDILKENAYCRAEDQVGCILEAEPALQD